MSLTPQVAVIIMISGFVAGLLFALAEVIIPSGGVLTILAVLSFGASIFCAFHVHVLFGVAILVALPFLVIGVIALGFKILPYTPMGEAAILSGSKRKREAEGIDVDDLSSLMGLSGVAESNLRPAGIARFGNQRVTVVTQGGMISKGTVVRAIEVNGNRVVVKAEQA